MCHHLSIACIVSPGLYVVSMEKLKEAHEKCSKAGLVETTWEESPGVAGSRRVGSCNRCCDAARRWRSAGSFASHVALVRDLKRPDWKICGRSGSLLFGEEVDFPRPRPC